PRERFAQPVAETDRRLADAECDLRRLLPVPVTGEAPGGDRIVVWPHRAEVVADRVVPALAFRHRADAPTGEELVTHQVLYTASSFVLVGDSAPEQVADVRSHRVHLPAVAVDGEREAASGLEPIVSVEPRLQLRGGPVQPDGELGIVPDLPGEASAADLRVVQVALDPTSRPRHAGGRGIRVME